MGRAAVPTLHALKLRLAVVSAAEMDVDERTRMEALKNPRARGPADLARTITNARTRAAPPAPPEPQQTVTEADQQDKAKLEAQISEIGK